MPKKKGGNGGQPNSATPKANPPKAAPKAAAPKAVAPKAVAPKATVPKSNAVSKEEKIISSARACTGTLSSQEHSRDVQFYNFSMSLHGIELVKDSTLELNYGRRYGLIGFNGCGKSSLLACLGEREIPIPEHVDIYLLEAEVKASDVSALQTVLDEIEQVREALELESEELIMNDPENELGLQAICERLEELEYNTAEARAGKILYGLGFSKEMQRKATKEFSGGWRMRISLAKALILRPMLLLLDEPTNHLDLEACVWLEEYLKDYNHTLVLVSHSQDFMNAVCTNIMHLHNKKLTYYTGNYDNYVRVRAEKEEHQMKRFQTEQDRIKQYKEFIAKFGHGTKKLARQAKSREKSLARMKDNGLTEKVVTDRVQSFLFPDCEDLPPPVLQFENVSFAYPNKKDQKTKKYLFTNLDLGVDLDSRVALVGQNGAGKSTLLKLMVGDLIPTNGVVKRHQKLRLGWFHQHLSEKLDRALSPLAYLIREYPDNEGGDEIFRRLLGRYGVTGTTQTTPMGILSDGQKSRVVFAWLAWRQPQLLLLDEPTNHLDMETIDALADAINEYEGGVVLVSHDFRLINQVADEIWEVKNSGIYKWKDDISAYKTHLRSQILKDM